MLSACTRLIACARHESTGHADHSPVFMSILSTRPYLRMHARHQQLREHGTLEQDTSCMLDLAGGAWMQAHFSNSLIISFSSARRDHHHRESARQRVYIQMMARQQSSHGRLPRMHPARPLPLRMQRTCIILEVAAENRPIGSVAHFCCSLGCKTRGGEAVSAKL